MILALGDTGVQVDNMAHNILRAHWRDDADLSKTEVLERLAIDLGHDARALIEQAKSDLVQEKLHKNSDWAKNQNIFGSPTYIVDGDPFYGQDHLELLERALSRPFAPTGWINPPVN